MLHLADSAIFPSSVYTECGYLWATGTRVDLGALLSGQAMEVGVRHQSWRDKNPLSPPQAQDPRIHR